MSRKSVIKQMFYGERGNYENIPLSKEYRATEKKAFDAIDAFLENLNNQQKELFDSTYEHIIDKCAEYAEDHFVEGFKFGFLLGVEVTENKAEKPL